MEQAKSKRGAPKLDWTPFDTELQKRLEAGKAKETVTEEAKHLESWARANQHCTRQGKYQKWERIRDRIRKRYGGATGYKQARAWHIDKLIEKASLAQLN